MTKKEDIAKRLERIKGVLDADMWHDSLRDKNIVRKPFYLQGKSRAAVLLLHGWTSTPYEFRKFGQYLHKQGFTVYAPLLTGHGSQPDHLEKVGYDEWMQDIENAYKKLQENHEYIYVGGNSMGASLSALLAYKHSDIAGIMLLGMPYKIRMEMVIHYYIRFRQKFYSGYFKKRYPRGGVASRAITQAIAYSIYPLSNVLEVFKVVQAARKALANISQPAIILQSRQDHLVAKGSIDRIYEDLGSQVKYKKYLDNAYHTFIADRKHAYIYKEVLRFLKKLQSV